jgi:hypothetical protein
MPANRGAADDVRITVIDVCRELGVQLRPALTWAIGAAVREHYRTRYGRLPAKNLRDKTYSSGGSHCFALYPVEMRGEIAAIICRYLDGIARQRRLWE